jgi:hypothetical protein
VFCHRYSFDKLRTGLSQRASSGKPHRSRCDAGADGVRSLRDKVSRVRKGSGRIVRGGCDCQHQAVRGEDGVVWSTEVNC